MMKKYANGREAKELDQVVGTYTVGDVTAVVAGTLQIDPDPEKPIGIIHVQSATGVIARQVTLANLHHAEDLLKVLAEVGKVQAAVGAAGGA